MSFFFVRILFFLLFLFLFTKIFAYDMILTGDPILEDIRFLSLETGRPFLSFSPPLAPGEVSNFLNLIDETTLSSPALEAYERIQRRLQPSGRRLLTSDFASVLFNVDLAFEGRIRANADERWQSHYGDITPLLSIPIRIHFSNYVQFFIEPSLQMRRGRYGSGNFDINIPFAYNDTDPNVPLRTFMAVGGRWWNFHIGRDNFFWGTGHSGSLSFNDPSEFNSFARLSFFSRRIKYSVMVKQLPLWVTPDLFDGRRFYKNENGKWFLDGSEVLINRSFQRHLYMHRLDLKFANRVSVGLMEGLMVGNSPLQIRYLNPMIIFHSLFSWGHNDSWIEKTDEHHGSDGNTTSSFFSLDVNWNIKPSLAVYGQAAVMEFATPGEIANNPQQPPNSLGFLAGVQYSHSFNNWGSVFFLEFIYTNPYLYVQNSPFSSFIQQRRRGYPSSAPGAGDFGFIGYPRDTMALVFGANFFNHGSINLSGTFSWISKGEKDKNGLTWDWSRDSDYKNASAPTGTAEHQFILSLGAEWQAFENLKLGTNLIGIYSHNHRHIREENRFGGQLSFTAKYRF